MSCFREGECLDVGGYFELGSYIVNYFNIAPAFEFEDRMRIGINVEKQYLKIKQAKENENERN